MATQAQIAAHLDLSTRRVKELVAEGVLQTGADLDECRVNYIRYLRGNASGKHTGATPILADGRARLVKLQGDKVEIELAELRGEVVRADDVARVMQSHVIAARSRLLALPSKLVALFSPDMRPQTLALSDGVIREALDELSSDEFLDEVRKRAAAADNAPVAPAAETDGQRVGGSIPQAKQRGKRRAGTVAPRR
jgi:phage terminase Nu1 subunit (DNA packaging protein)